MGTAPGGVREGRGAGQGHLTQGRVQPNGGACWELYCLSVSVGAMDARNERATLVQERQAVRVKGEGGRLRKLEEGAGRERGKSKPQRKTQ